MELVIVQRIIYLMTRHENSQICLSPGGNKKSPLKMESDCGILYINAVFGMNRIGSPAAYAEILWI